MFSCQKKFKKKKKNFLIEYILYIRMWSHYFEMDLGLSHKVSTTILIFFLNKKRIYYLKFSYTLFGFATSVFIKSKAFWPQKNKNKNSNAFCRWLLEKLNLLVYNG